MTGIDKVMETFDRLLAALRRTGFSYRVLRYPEEASQRSIDVFASKDERKLFIKIVDDVSSVKRDDVKELKSVSSVLGASPLVVADSEYGEKLEDIVAYEKMGVYTVSPEGFERAVEGGIYVVKKRGRFYMRLDAARFREARLRKGLSLGVTAEYLGVTRRAVYEYERSNIDVDLNKALRILDVFGEEVFQPINIFVKPDVKSIPANQKFDEEGEERIAQAIGRAGGVAVHARRTMVDLAVRLGSQTSLILYKHRREKPEGLIKRGEEAMKVGEQLSSNVYAIVGEESVAKDLEALGINVLQPNEAVEEIVNRMRRE